jgi:hypothetical protein
MLEIPALLLLGIIIFVVVLAIIGLIVFGVYRSRGVSDGTLFRHEEIHDE